MKYLIGVLILCLFILGSYGESRAQDNQPVPEEKINNEYTVGIDDILDISVLQPEKFISTVTVAPDGTISFPYVGNIKINGMSLTQVQDEIQKQLADGYMKYPVVSVSLRENRSRKFYIYGEVIKPGTYMLQDKTTVLKAITMAGGFSKYGSSSRVKVLRMEKDGSGYKTIKVNISDVMSGNSSKDEILQPQDIVVISEGIF
ncbi:MAG: polysaccharide biosynthesis/export family protein [Candidatus Omnitrophota bacterium]